MAAAERARLILRPEALTRVAARRFRARVRALESLLRRLLVLIAATLETPLPEPRPERPAPAPAHAGAESRPRPRHTGFTLIPEAGIDPDRLAALRARPKAAPRPVTPGPLLARYRILLHHLAHPRRLARQMARHLAALRAAGQPRPICVPPENTARLGPELGALAYYLPEAVREALAGWYDSG